MTPVEKVPIEVEATPFVAVEMRAGGNGKTQRLTFRTNVDDVVVADREHPLGFERGDKGSFVPFIVVRGVLTAQAGAAGLLRARGARHEADRRQGTGRVERRHVLPVSRGRG